mgnify:CR=1 FL=1
MAQTLGEVILLFGLSPDRFAELQHLGMANRTAITLPDVADDICKDIVNIPKEDCER